MPEQRNKYRGSRPWLRLGFKAPDGEVHHFDLVADTGSAAPIILTPASVRTLTYKDNQDRTSNFGMMIGGWIRLYCPELGLVEFTRAYGTEKVTELVQKSDANFVGLVGLPILRLTEYGGNADEFWIRLPS